MSPTVLCTLTQQNLTAARSTRTPNWCRRQLEIRRPCRKEKVIGEKRQHLKDTVKWRKIYKGRQKREQLKAESSSLMGLQLIIFTDVQCCRITLPELIWLMIAHLKVNNSFVYFISNSLQMTTDKVIVLLDAEMIFLKVQFLLCPLNINDHLSPLKFNSTF